MKERGTRARRVHRDMGCDTVRPMYETQIPYTKKSFTGFAKLLRFAEQKVPSPVVGEG